ncbi:MAG: hypothetical protein ACYCSF_12295 [Acidimicrobiales bacterium]
MDTDQTPPDAATAEAEDKDERAAHVADRAPTPEEERVAESSDLDPEVAEHYREAIKTGAEVKGEGEPA